MPSKIRLALCRMYPRATKFQNIVCYCLSSAGNRWQCGHGISKHRMLLFIKTGRERRKRTPQFQNIVCYCLSRCIFFYSKLAIISKHRMLLSIISSPLNKAQNTYFKTSYVTVYRSTASHLPLLIGFQNIVCYCLSETLHRKTSSHMNFKTSYVTVYLKRFTNVRISASDFKTSYVTVYRS